MIGMPATLKLDEFASHVWEAFESQPYLVGSALRSKGGWRDVDVRVMLSDAAWRRLGLGDPTPNGNRRNGRWVALCLAFSALGREMTGLPIDFQVQQLSYANAEYAGQPRSALGLVPLRWVDEETHSEESPPPPPITWGSRRDL